MTKLTNHLIEIEKQKLINKGTDKVNDLLCDLLNKPFKTAEKKTNDTQPKDSITPPKNTVEKDVKNVLDGLLNSKKKKKDTIN